MAHKTLIGGTAYEISGGKTLVNGTAYSIANGKTLVGGTAYEVGFRQMLGDLPVGSSVYFKVNGVPQEFIVVHQGLPSSVYDSSCNGTWLLMKDIYEMRAWDTASPFCNDYAISDIHSYLNNTFINLFNDIKSTIKQVKIPYTNGNGVDGSVATGANGLSAKIFLLSCAEVSYNRQGVNTEGSALDYFYGLDSSAQKGRIAYLNGTAKYWWTRSPLNTVRTYPYSITSAGAATTGAPKTEYGIRPAFILPSDFILD